jgi:hypothetical protein
MGTRLLIVGLVGVFMAGCGSSKQDSYRGYEISGYKIIEKQDGIELRLYAPQIVAETVVSGDFADVGNEGFRRLFNYISGGNRSKQSISMTAPVGQQSQSEKISMTAPVNQQKTGDSYVITFKMPSNYTMETLPEPNDVRIALRQIPEYYAAAIRYTGTWSLGRYQKHETKLRDFITQRGLALRGEPIFARYDPPFMPFFFRRNEILIEIDKPEKAQGD